MIDINNLTTTETELEELNLSSDSENCLNELSEKEEATVYGAGAGYTSWGRPVEN